MTAIREPIVIASTWSWVTYTIVVSRRWWSRAISARVWTRSLASRLDSGSSIRNTAGSRTMARPSATRWRWPPDSSFGLRSSSLSSWMVAAVSLTRRSISALGTLRSLSPNARLSRTDMCG